VEEIEQPITIAKKRGPKAGHPKWGGRRPGTLNKRTRYAHEVAEKMRVDPVAYLLSIINQEATQEVIINPQTGEAILDPATGQPKRRWVPVTRDQRIDAAKALLGYLYPKLQAVQVTGKDEEPLQVEMSALSVTQILSDPALADAAQKMALMLAEQLGPEKPHTGHIVPFDYK
jgi:hypothetical protein